MISFGDDEKAIEADRNSPVKAKPGDDVWDRAYKAQRGALSGVSSVLGVVLLAIWPKDR